MPLRFRHSPLPILTVTAALAAAFLSGCDDQSHQTDDSVRPVRSVVAKMEPHVLMPSQVGEIRAHVESDLGFKISGRILERKADLGDMVHKGQLLARLSEEDQRNQLQVTIADVAAARASLDQAEAEERRQAQLRQSGWATQARYESALQARDTARANLRAAEARRRQAEDTRSYAELRAPEDGAISAVGAEAGQVVNAGQIVLRLARLDQKDAVFTVAESSLALLSTGTEVEVALLDAPQVAARGHIDQIAPTADPQTRTYMVKVALDNPPPALRLGMTVVGRIQAGGQPVAVLPAAALFQKDGHAALWVADPQQGTVDLVPVTLAGQDAGRIMVSDGLKDGAIVVTAGTQRLWPGQKVRLSPDDIGTGAPRGNNQP